MQPLLLVIAATLALIAVLVAQGMGRLWWPVALTVFGLVLFRCGIDADIQREIVEAVAARIVAPGS